MQQGGLGCIIEQETLVTSLSSGKPNEIREILAFLASKLPSDPHSTHIKNFIKPVLGCLEDRSAEVRKAAQDCTAVLAHMYVHTHLYIYMCVCVCVFVSIYI